MQVRRAKWKGSEFQSVQNSSVASMDYGTKSVTKADSCLPLLPLLSWLPTSLYKRNGILPLVIPGAEQILQDLP